jgi:hypothetical protein
VTTNPQGRVLVTHWAYYLSIAREARDETQRVVTGNPDALPTSSITAIILSALAVEAFINELAEAADMAEIGREGISSSSLDVLRDLAGALKEVEEDKGSIGLKYQMAYKILSGHTFPRGQTPFQEFRELVALRNLLVHLRPGDRHSSSGHVEPASRIIRDFQNKGLTRTKGRKPGDPLGGMSWLQEIQTSQMAAWAYQAACDIIRAVGAVLPNDPLAGSIDFSRTTTQSLPR